jgi:hypothetical protein
MLKITDKTFQQIETDLSFNGLYKYSQTKDIFCIHINSIVNIGLVEFGYTEKAHKNFDEIIQSRLFSRENNLFYREIDNNNIIINDYFNTCKNALAILALTAVDNKFLAEKVVNALYNSPLFNKKIELFAREFNLKNKTIKPLIITQSNLWLALALIKLQQTNNAQKIIRDLEKLNFDSETNLFVSQDCERKVEINIADNDYDVQTTPKENKKYFPDDQALAIIVYKLLNEDEKAKQLLDSVIKSKLYDNETGLFNRDFDQAEINKTKTSYKNGLMGIALRMMGYEKELNKLNNNMINMLYDKSESLFNFSDTDSTKIPDNSVLALLSVGFNDLKHKLF